MFRLGANTNPGIALTPDKSLHHKELRTVTSGKRSYQVASKRDQRGMKAAGHRRPQVFDNAGFARV